MSKDNSGPAFPLAVDEFQFKNTGLKADGLSKREWLAGLAMQGILAAEGEDCGYVQSYMKADGTETNQRQSPPNDPSGKPDYSKTPVENKLLYTVVQNQARAAVEAADALLKELAK